MKAAGFTGLAALAGAIGIALALADGVHAQGKKGLAGKDAGAAAEPAGDELAPDMIGAFFPQRADVAAMRRRGFFATGLRPHYPADAKCLEANSFFADTTRGDGSARSARFYAGHHGGLDIPAPEGTPIVAVADGAVVHKSEGGGIGGIGIVLRHSPQDTGFSVWVYTEYKHLREMPDIELGQYVKMGEVIAYAGKTGTVGTRAYGSAGHSHLHLTAWYAAGDKYRPGRMLIPLDGYWMDPLALFRGPPVTSGEIAKLPEEAKKVPLSYKGTDGRVVPASTRIVWPFACETR
jgi:murein DD-endopeptidase MepM/ murein hydrolase activator NlpD